MEYYFDFIIMFATVFFIDIVILNPEYSSRLDFLLQLGSFLALFFAVWTAVVF